jgi:acyl carrier protein
MRTQPERLAALFAEVLRVPVETIQETTSPRTLPAWDSLRHVELVVAVENAYRVRFSGAEVLSLQSLETFRTLLQKKGAFA